MQSEIARYMGHRGEPDAVLAALIAVCRNKLDGVCSPRHTLEQLPCTIRGDVVSIGAINIASEDLARHIMGCTRAYLFAATLGADVDRIIARQTRVDSAEALCLQACAAAYIEDYCDRIEKDLADKATREGFVLRPRFSPGYGDFDIACQSDVLRVTLAHKRIGLAETKTHMLTPLKSVTAVTGIIRDTQRENRGGAIADSGCAACNCGRCGRTDCAVRFTGTSPRSALLS